MAERLSESSAVSVCAAMMLLEKKNSNQVDCCQPGKKKQRPGNSLPAGKNTFQLWIAKKEKNKSRASRLQNARKENDE